MLGDIRSNATRIQSRKVAKLTRDYPDSFSSNKENTPALKKEVSLSLGSCSNTREARQIDKAQPDFQTLSHLKLSFMPLSASGISLLYTSRL